MIAVRGSGSAIVKALRPLLPDGEIVIEVDRNGDMPLDVERYLFCAGVLRPKKIADQSAEEIAETFLINAGRVIQDCERIIEANDTARIAIIGSESAIKGCFDSSYSCAKAGVHAFVESKKLRTPEQQIICIAPSIIADAGMTQRREDIENLEQKKNAHPKRRFLDAIEVARIIRFLLYDCTIYLTGVTLRLNGGQHTI